jgi:hypothetical protein
VVHATGGRGPLGLCITDACVNHLEPIVMLLATRSILRLATAVFLMSL